MSGLHSWIAARRQGVLCPRSKQTTIFLLAGRCLMSHPEARLPGVSSEKTLRGWPPRPKPGRSDADAEDSTDCAQCAGIEPRSFKLAVPPWGFLCRPSFE